MPSDVVVEKVVAGCQVTPENLILLVAPTASVAGLVQVVGRIVETGIHKLHNCQRNSLRLRLRTTSSTLLRLRSSHGTNK